jgi:hypothetical protein
MFRSRNGDPCPKCGKVNLYGRKEPKVLAAAERMPRDYRETLKRAGV